MEYVRLGNTGMKVSRLCLGCMTYGSSTWRPWVLDERQSKPFFKQAVEAGINFFDTADMYSLGASETVTGKLLKEYAKRDDLVIATKVYQAMSDKPNDRGLSRKHILSSIDNSLKRLGTDYVDLYIIHRWDYHTPIEETLEALNDVVRAGKARYIGASSMWSWQFMQALKISEQHGWAKFVSMQNHYNLIYREEEREMLPLCQAQGIGVTPWSPLARGFLAGNRSKDDTAKKGATARAKSDDLAQGYYYGASDFKIAERCEKVAKKHGVKAIQVALAWMLSKSVITAPIIGASKAHHISDAVGALDIKLSDADVKILEEPYQPHAVMGHV